jgi:DHA1 family bicyclomycin/chloramphenicol resistance-like MFS transporter
MFSAGIGQLAAGTLSDRFGRRRVIQSGLAVYLAGAVLATLAPNIEVLLAARVLQGIGGGFSMVIARAILRDLFSRAELARNMAFSSAVFAFGPIVAPLVGAGLMLVFPWRSIFVLMILFVFGLIIVAVFRLPETLARPDRDSLRPGTWIANIGAILADRQSRFFLLLSGVSHTMMVLIIVGVARVYEKEFGIAGPAFAIFFAVHGIGIVAGQIANRRLIAATGVVATSRIAAAVLLAATMAILALALAGIAGPVVVSFMFVAFATSYLIVYSNAAAMTLDPHGSIAGFTSSFFGFFSQSAAGAMVVLLAPLVAGDLIRFGAVLSLLATVVLLSLLAYRTGDRVGYAN